MDIKGQIESIVKKIKDDDKFADKFKKNPEKAIEEVSGIDIPDGMIGKVAEGVQAKLAGDKISGAIGSLKKMF